MGHLTITTAKLLSSCKKYRPSANAERNGDNVPIPPLSTIPIFRIGEKECFMKTKILHEILLLLTVCLALSACRHQGPNPADYNLPEYAQVAERSDGRVWVVKQQPEKNLPIVLPEEEDFALISSANECFFDTTKQYNPHSGPIVHARYDENKYYIRFFETEWLYAPDANGTYWLWQPDGEVFRKQNIRKTEEEVLSWFFSDLSEGSMSIAMICGVWGEPTGKQAQVRIYDYNQGQAYYVLCDEYDFYGILQYADPETGLATVSLACCEWRQMVERNQRDVDTAAIYYLNRPGVYENVWGNISANCQKPVLAD